MRLLMNSDDFADYDYDDLEDNRVVWYHIDSTKSPYRTGGQDCDQCGQKLKDKWYVSNEDKMLCPDCVQVLTIFELVRAWRRVHDPKSVPILTLDRDILCQGCYKNIHYRYTYDPIFSKDTKADHQKVTCPECGYTTEIWEWPIVPDSIRIGG